jgi:hypothetical protein
MHAQIAIDADIAICFADPQPLVTRLEREHQWATAPVPSQRHQPAPLHTRGPHPGLQRTERPPRKTLDWRTPAEALDDILGGPYETPVLH